MEAWEELLPLNYPDREELMTGIREGFRITSRDYSGPDVWQRNYQSALNQNTRAAVEAQIKEEISNGRYLVQETPARLVSALAAIPKPGSDKVRLIHDCSRPLGGALNDFADPEGYRYQTLRDAAGQIFPGDYLAKVDLASAYRSVKIHPQDQELTGLEWKFEGDDHPTHLRDGRLPFGACRSPGLFNRLTQAVRGILAEAGHPRVVAYLDDFLVVGATYQECQEALNHLLWVVRRLGFAVNYNKVIGPSHQLVFLGVQIDTWEYTLTLPQGKLRDLLEEAGRVAGLKQITKRELQSIVGKLSWASQCIYGGRAHLRRIIDRINVLGAPHHKTRVTEGIREDLRWWIENVRIFNGSIPIVESRPVTHVCIDASGDGAGGYTGGDWYHLPWLHWPEAAAHHINYKEVLALAPAVDLWGQHWSGHTVIIYSDNQAAVGILNRGTAKDPFVMSVMRRIFWASVFHDFRLKAVYYPGYLNRVADAASRLMEPGGRDRLQEALDHTFY